MVSVVREIILKTNDTLPIGQTKWLNLGHRYLSIGLCNFF